MNIQHSSNTYHTIWQWNLDTKEQDKATITAAEMPFLRKTAKYTLYNRKRDQDIIKEPKHKQFWKNQQL
jgi:hypothetical protein